MTNEEKKYEEAIAKAARKYQKNIETNNPQAEAWDFYNAFISGATWRDKQSANEKQALIDKACEWVEDNVSKHYKTTDLSIELAHYLTKLFINKQ